MRATVMYGACDVRVENVADARIAEPADALVRVTRACVCGSDLWPYTQMEATEHGRRMGHEFIGIVEDVGTDVRAVKRGDLGAHSVLECVGHDLSMETALGIVRAGGAGGRVGVPRHEQIPTTSATFYANVTISGGPAPVRAYIEELLPDVLEGRIEPGRVLGRTGSLDDVPEGYRLMNDRKSIKLMVKP